MNWIMGCLLLVVLLLALGLMLTLDALDKLSRENRALADRALLAEHDADLRARALIHQGRVTTWH